MGNEAFGRRRLIAGALGVAGSGLALAACGGSGKSTGGSDTGGQTTASAPIATSEVGTGSPTGSSSSSSGGGATTPAYVPFTGVKPDLPAGDNGLPGGYFHYPSSPPTFIDHPLGNGDDITFLLEEGNAVALPMNQNKWWQGINSAVKANLKITTVSNAGSSVSYTTKLQVTVAGGDLPDVVQLLTLPRMTDILEKDFTDLTEYLAGDAIKQYPGLASIPTATWQIPTLNGRIWGVAQPRPAAGQIASTRGDLLKGFGVSSNSPQVSSGQDFMDLCKELTDVKRGKYAIGEQPNTWVLNAMLEMHGAPNGWKEENGTFTSVNETDEMKAALEQTTNIWKAGYIHPDSFVTPQNNLTWWTGGITSIYFQSIAGWGSYANLHPTWDIGVVTLPKWNGGGPANKILGVAGYPDFAAIKKTSASRVQEILRVLDFIAAPFGTKEFLTVNWGVEGVDYTLNGSDPVGTDVGRTEQLFDLQYCGAQLNLNVYVPGAEDLVKAEHEYLASVLPTGVPNPTWGLYSDTAATKGATANKNLQDVQADIVQGRKSLSEWDSAVKDWVTAAGDAERKEYEQAFAARAGGS
jgi:putative aldouronate transport system substrate-binding protein